MTKAIVILLGIISSIVLWFLKNRFGKAGRILKLKEQIDELEKEDKLLKEKHTAALAVGQPIDDIFVKRQQLSRAIADLRNKLRKEGVDY